MEGDAGGDLLGVVGDVDEGALRAGTILLDDCLGELFFAHVEAMERFVEDEKLRAFDECPHKEDEALLTVGDLDKGALRKVVGREAFHPRHRDGELLISAFAEEPYGVEEATGDDFEAGDILHVVGVHVGREVADATLDLPDTLPRATTTAEEGYVVGICLRVVATNEAQKHRFATAVGTEERPFFTLFYDPIDIFENCDAGIFDRDAMHLHHFVVWEPLLRALWQQQFRGALGVFEK